MENNAQKDNQISPVNSETKFAYFRLIIGFLIAIFGMLFSFCLGIDDKPSIAVAMIGMITGLVSIFITGNIQ